MLQKIPLAPKSVLISIVLAAVVWLAMDFFQTRQIKELFQAQLNERLGELAARDRIRLDYYIKHYQNAAKLLVSQKQLINYVGLVSKDEWPANAQADIQIHDDLPLWLPAPSILRALVDFRYAILADSSLRVREVYRSMPDTPPASLLKPTTLFLQLSHQQTILTEIEEQPYIISMARLKDSSLARDAVLILASPMDNDFLMASQVSAHPNKVTALVDSDKQTVIASDRPDLFPPGVLMESLQGKYILTGKSFFDYGYSDLHLQFASFLPISEYELLSSTILAKERQSRGLVAVALVVFFVVFILLLTRRIKNITGKVLLLSEKTLGSKLNDSVQGGDELAILDESFHRFADEITSSHEAILTDKIDLEEVQSQLRNRNREISESREKLKDALEKISSLIQLATTEKGFGVRFENPNLRKCYKEMKCTHEDCVCYGKEAMRCWLEHSNVYCKGVSTMFQGGRHTDCYECPVYKAATEDPVFQIGEQFNNMMYILELKNKELEDAYKELKMTQSQMLQQEKMASIGVLSAGVAHEINNPIGFVSSNLGSLEKYIDRLVNFINDISELIGASTDSGLSEKFMQKRKKLKLDFILEDIKDLISESLEGTDRVVTIVKNLKSFSRVDEAKCKLTNINECIESTISIVWNELKYKAVVNKEYGDLPMTYCFPQQLNQVFMNLLVNAGQAIEKKGEIGIRTWADGKNIYISVSDTGSGIPEENLSHLFEPFFTTKEVGKGTGLGLSIAYDIITKTHNGNISAQSETGRGTTFTVTLPIVTEASNRPES